MRFRQQGEPGDASGIRELMPKGFANGMQIQIGDDFGKHLAQQGDVAQFDG
jgi:hypothetical protein